MSSAESLSKFQSVETSEISREFCDALTECYGPEKLRLMLQAQYFVAEVERMSCRQKRYPQKFEKVWLTDPDGEGMTIDGVFVGATLLGVVPPEGGSLKEVPHAVLYDATLIGEGLPLTNEPAERIMVPMQNLEDFYQVTFYR